MPKPFFNLQSANQITTVLEDVWTKNAVLIADKPFVEKLYCFFTIDAPNDEIWL